MRRWPRESGCAMRRKRTVVIRNSPRQDAETFEQINEIFRLGIVRPVCKPCTRLAPQALTLRETGAIMVNDTMEKYGKTFAASFAGGPTDGMVSRFTKPAGRAPGSMTLRKGGEKTAAHLHPSDRVPPCSPGSPFGRGSSLSPVMGKDVIPFQKRRIQAEPNATEKKKRRCE